MLEKILWVESFGRLMNFLIWISKTFPRFEELSVIIAWNKLSASISFSSVSETPRIIDCFSLYLIMHLGFLRSVSFFLCTRNWQAKLKELFMTNIRIVNDPLHHIDRYYSAMKFFSHSWALSLSHTEHAVNHGPPTVFISKTFSKRSHYFPLPFLTLWSKPQSSLI